MYKSNILLFKLIISNLILPKYSKRQLDETSYEQIKLLAEEIINYTKSAMLAKVAMASGAALMGLGILLIAFGQLPQGIGLLAAGALLLYGGARLAEGQVSEKTKKMLTTITTAAGLALIALGIILLCFGIIPTGIALLFAGAVSLVSAVALQEGTIVQKIQSVLKEIAKTYNYLMNKGFSFDIIKYEMRHYIDDMD